MQPKIDYFQIKRTCNTISKKQHFGASLDTQMRKNGKEKERKNENGNKNDKH